MSVRGGRVLYLNTIVSIILGSTNKYYNTKYTLFLLSSSYLLFEESSILFYFYVTKMFSRKNVERYY